MEVPAGCRRPARFLSIVLRWTLPVHERGYLIVHGGAGRSLLPPTQTVAGETRSGVDAGAALVRNCRCDFAARRLCDSFLGGTAYGPMRAISPVSIMEWNTWNQVVSARNRSPCSCMTLVFMTAPRTARRSASRSLRCGNKSGVRYEPSSR